MQRWSLDFSGDQLVDFRQFRALNIVQDHSRFCPGQIVDVSFTGARMARFLDDLALRYGRPDEIVLDSRPEGTSRAIFDWSERTGVRLRFIEPGKSVPVLIGTCNWTPPKTRADGVLREWFVVRCASSSPWPKGAQAAGSDRQLDRAAHQHVAGGKKGVRITPSVAPVEV